MSDRDLPTPLRRALEKVVGGYAGDTIAASASMLRVYDLVIERAGDRVAA